MSIIIHQFDRVRRPALALLVALALFVPFAAGAVPAAAANTAGQISTRNIILGALALGAGLVIYNNYHQKYVAAHTIVGYTRDGGTVFADGRIVYPDGTVVYTSNNGRSVCTWDGYGDPYNQCRNGNVYGYFPQNTSWQQEQQFRRHHGHAYGLFKHHQNDQGEDNDDDDD